MNENGRDSITESDQQFLTFRLGSEEYGIEILSVQEIRGWSGATPLPESPSHVLGVINLRGKVVPIVDLRRRFALAGAEFGATTVVIVVRLDSETGEQIAGFVVDAVCEVYAVPESERRAVPDSVTRGGEFVTGLATVDEKMVILLEVGRLLAESFAAQPRALAS